MAEVLLPAVPSLGPVVGRALLASRLPKSDTLPDTTLVVRGHAVDRAHLTAYQQICGWGVSDALPHPYPHVLSFPLQAQLMGTRGFPLPLVGLVHLENQITVHRPLTAADALDLRVHARHLRPHPKGRVVDLVIEADVDGERVWEGVSTYLARGRGDATATTSRSPQAPEGMPSATWRLPEDLGRAYAAVSGDANPIHLYPLTAKAMGFPRHIAHGMWTYARTLAALGRPAEGAGTSHVWFRKPVFLPGRVSLLVDRGADRDVAALVSAKDPAVEHLVLTLDR